jgi:4-amino-4-deoxy-L-arabinose transferase-like glycosyltransferase
MLKLSASRHNHHHLGVIMLAKFIRLAAGIHAAAVSDAQPLLLAAGRFLDFNRYLDLRVRFHRPAVDDQTQDKLFIWLAVGLAFLLVWSTIWPQYVLLVLPPLCMATAERVQTLFLERLIRCRRSGWPGQPGMA